MTVTVSVPLGEIVDAPDGDALNGPVAEMLVTWMGPVPVFLRVSDCESLRQILTVPNVSLFGVTVRCPFFGGGGGAAKEVSPRLEIESTPEFTVETSVAVVPLTL